MGLWVKKAPEAHLIPIKITPKRSRGLSHLEGPKSAWEVNIERKLKIWAVIICRSSKRDIQLYFRPLFGNLSFTKIHYKIMQYQCISFRKHFNFEYVKRLEHMYYGSKVMHAESRGLRRGTIFWIQHVTTEKRFLKKSMIFQKKCYLFIFLKSFVHYMANFSSIELHFWYNGERIKYEYEKIEKYVKIMPSYNHTQNENYLEYPHEIFRDYQLHCLLPYNVFTFSSK